MHETNLGSRIRRRLVAFAAAVLVAFGLVAAGPVVAFARGYVPVKAEVPVAFNVTGDTPKADETFTAIMTPAAGETVKPAQASVSVTGAGKASFGLSFNEVGEHHYTITQAAGNAQGWTYDTQTYDVTAYCMWNESDDTIYTQVFIENASGEKTDLAEFTNTYDAPAGENAAPTGENAAPAGVTKFMPQTGDATPYVAVAVLVCAGVAAGVAGVLARRRGGK